MRGALAQFAAVGAMCALILVVEIAGGLFTPLADAQGLSQSVASPAIPGDATIAAGGTAQPMFGGVRPIHGWLVANPNTSDDLWCSDSAAAAVNGLGSVRIAANGGLYETPDAYLPSAPVSCVGPTTGDKVTARRW